MQKKYQVKITFLKCFFPKVPHVQTNDLIMFLIKGISKYTVILKFFKVKILLLQLYQKNLYSFFSNILFFSQNFGFFLNWASPIVFLVQPILHGHILRWFSVVCIPKSTN